VRLDKEALADPLTFPPLSSLPLSPFISCRLATGLSLDLRRRTRLGRLQLNAEIWWINTIVNAPGSPGYLNTSDYQLIGAHVVKQCDALDGVEDGIITNPSACKPDLQQLSCDAPGANSTSCLSAEQIVTMYRIYGDMHKTTGEWLFPGYMPGAEGIPGFSVTGAPYTLASVPLPRQPLSSRVSSLTPSPCSQPRLLQLPGPEPDRDRQLHGEPDRARAPPRDRRRDGSGCVLRSLLSRSTSRMRLYTLPCCAGKSNAVNPNIQPFLKRGKLLTFVGPSRPSQLQLEHEVRELTLSLSRRAFRRHHSVRVDDLVLRAGAQGARVPVQPRRLVSHVHECVLSSARAALGESRSPRLRADALICAVPGMGHCRAGPGAWQ